MQKRRENKILKLTIETNVLCFELLCALRRKPGERLERLRLKKLGK